MSRRWTSEEDELLLELYQSGASREAIGQGFGRSADAIDARRRFLSRPARTKPPRRWTQAEDAFLRAASAAGVPGPEVARRLDRTPYAVRRRREVIGATRPRAPRYRSEEDALIVSAVTSGSLAALVPRLGRTEGALRLRAKALGLITVKTRRRWTAQDDAKLRAAYADGLSTTQIKERLLPDRSGGAIVARAHLLGLAETGRRWTVAEDRELAFLVGFGVSATYVANRLARSAEAVNKRCRVLGLLPPPSSLPRRRGPWSQAEDERLAVLAQESITRLVVVFERSPSAIRRRRHRLGLAPPQRTHHHPLRNATPTRGQVRAIADELPLTPARALAVARRLDLPLSEIRRVARERRWETENRASPHAAAGLTIIARSASRGWRGQSGARTR